MNQSPALWGVGLAFALGGAIAGNALGSTPPLDRSVLTDFYQLHPSSEGDALQQQRPPDHYPLVTNAGVVPVGELSMRGLYSQARYQPRVYPAHYAASEIGVAPYRYEEDWRPDYESEVHQAVDEPEQRNAAAAEAPLQLASAPATMPAEGEAKLIDVNAALAMR